MSFPSNYEDEWLRKRVLKLLKHRIGQCGAPTDGKRSIRDVMRAIKHPDLNVGSVTLSYYLSGKRKRMLFWMAIRLATELDIDLGELQNEIRKRKKK